MKKSITILIAIFINQALLGQSYQDNWTNENAFQADNIDVKIDPNTKILTVTYDINNYDPKDFFIADIEYYEFFSGKTVYPREESIAGHVGMTAFKGGSGRKIYWDFKKQGSSSLEVGQFQVDVHLVKRDESVKLYKLYKKQYRITSKLERKNLKSEKRRRLEKRLEKTNRRIGRD